MAMNTFYALQESFNYIDNTLHGLKSYSIQLSPEEITQLKTECLPPDNASEYQNALFCYLLQYGGVFMSIYLSSV